LDRLLGRRVLLLGCLLHVVLAAAKLFEGLLLPRRRLEVLGFSPLTLLEVEPVAHASPQPAFRT